MIRRSFTRTQHSKSHRKTMCSCLPTGQHPMAVVFHSCYRRVVSSLSSPATSWAVTVYACYVFALSLFVFRRSLQESSGMLISNGLRHLFFLIDHRFGFGMILLPPRSRVT